MKNADTHLIVEWYRKKGGINMMKMPVVFAGHGSPMNIIEQNRFTDGWRQIAKELPRPKAILCVSAHWFTDGQMVSTARNPETIYDFYGFPNALYEITYPAQGAPEIAETVSSLLGMPTNGDSVRGLDHGAWSVLHFMFPEADVPVFQLSVNRQNTPEDSLEIGRRLRPLREQGILILGSGDVVHNLQLVDWEMGCGYKWANSFDSYIKEAVLSYNTDAVVHYERAGKEEQKSFYYRDHFEPLLYCMGAADERDLVKVYNDERVLGALSMTSFLWRSAE